VIFLAGRETNGGGKLFPPFAGVCERRKSRTAKALSRTAFEKGKIGFLLTFAKEFP
jgi:hypothetical protein